MKIPKDCTLHTGIPTKYVRRYSNDNRNCSPTTGTVHGVYYIRVY